MNDETLPLKERVCLSLMSSGVLSANGTYPLCLGNQCSNWEACQYSLEFNTAEMKRLHMIQEEEKNLKEIFPEVVLPKKKPILKREKKKGSLNGGIKKVGGNGSRTQGR